jgi:hypothetical protein
VTSAAKYRHPRTGEKRRRRHPLLIDRLSQDVKDVIVAARAAGETWKHTAEMASAAAGKRLSQTSVQRWYDLRIEQPEREAAIPLRRIVALLEDILSAVRQ